MCGTTSRDQSGTKDNQVMQFNGLLQSWRNQDVHTKYIIVISLALVVFAYLPTLQFDYVTQDQWRAFRYSGNIQSPLNQCKDCYNTISSYYVQTGRPFVWPTECLEHTFVSKISDFKFLRPISLAVVLGTILYLSIILECFTRSVPVAIMAGAVFVMTPGYSFMYFQGLPALMVLLSVPLSAASYKHHAKSISSQRYQYDQALASAVLFVTACMIYPSFAFIVLPLLFIRFAANNTSTILVRLRSLAISIFYYLFLSCIYYTIIKLTLYVMTSIQGTLPDLGIYKVSVQLIPEVIIERVKHVALYLWEMPPLNFAFWKGCPVIILFIFCLTCAISCSKKNANKARLSRIFIETAIVFAVGSCVLVASIAPWIFSHMDSLTTRHLLPVYMFLSFAVVWVSANIAEALFKKSRLKSPFLVVFFVLLPISMFQNRNSILEFVTSHLEIESLRSTVKRWAKNKQWLTDRYILVIRPTLSRPSGLGSTDSDNYGNDNAVLATSKNAVSIPWMMNAVMRENIDKREFTLVDCGSNTDMCVQASLDNPQNVIVGYSNGDEPITCPVQPYVINLTELTEKPVYPVIHVRESPTISASSVFNNFNCQRSLVINATGMARRRDAILSTNRNNRL